MQAQPSTKERSVLFNLCVSHGFIPEDCLITDIVSILKQRSL